MLTGIPEDYYADGKPFTLIATKLVSKCFYSKHYMGVLTKLPCVRLKWGNISFFPRIYGGRNQLKRFEY